MTPIRLLLLRDRRTLKSFWVKLTGSGPCPPLVNPPSPEALADRKGRPAPTTQSVPKASGPKPS